MKTFQLITTLFLILFLTMAPTASYPLRQGQKPIFLSPQTSLMNWPFGKRLRYYRLKAGMTQAELAKKMGYTSHAAISSIESGKNIISQKQLEKVPKVLGVSLSDLLGEKINEEVGLKLSRFGKGLKRYRLKANLTQKELAEKVGYASSLPISSLESGKSAPQDRFLRKILEVLGVSFSDLLREGVEEEVDLRSLSFGERLRYYRIEANLTQKELAGKVGYTSYSAISPLESGKNKVPKNSYLRKIADALGVSLSDLLGVDLKSLSFGERLRYYRIEANLTQKELAEKVGYASGASILFMESGRNGVLEIPQMSRLRKIADALGVSLSDLLGVDLKSLSFGKRLKYFRIKANLTQKELAEKVGYADHSAISPLESGKNKVPKNSYLRKIADALGVRLSDLLGVDLKSLSFGKRLEYFRIKANLTQKELAEKVGYKSNGAIHYLESEKTSLPHKRYLRKIAESLGVSLSQLLGEEVKDLNAAKNILSWNQVQLLEKAL